MFTTDPNPPSRDMSIDVRYNPDRAGNRVDHKVVCNKIKLFVLFGKGRITFPKLNGNPFGQFEVNGLGFNPPPFNMVSPVALAIQIPLLDMRRLPPASLILAWVPLKTIFLFSLIRE
ncbi:MAG: hypothetical protein IPN54_01140 [Bacteroidetes bacterium]|nr:hypothetical protein [Bacteroidota bacterium]